MPSATWDNLDEAKRERVLAAAVSEFGRHGFSSGSLNVVAREAGVAKGSLFQYFSDKLELFGVVCDHVSLRIRDEMTRRQHERVPHDLAFFDHVEALMALWVEFFTDHPRERALTIATTYEIDPEVRAAVGRVAHRHYLEVLDPLIARGVERGDLWADADLTVLSAYLLWLFPHLAVASTLPDVDPVLGLYGAGAHDVAALVTRLVAPLRAAFDPVPAVRLTAASLAT